MKISKERNSGSAEEQPLQPIWLQGLLLFEGNAGDIILRVPIV